MPERSADFWGAGFPVPLKLEDSRIQPASGEGKIRQSLYVILMTRQGERVMRPDFGSRIWDYVFDLPGQTINHMLCAEIERSILRWEHRVDHVRAQVDDSQIADGKLVISVSYTVRATNRPDNLVFPFYLEEGR